VTVTVTLSEVDINAIGAALDERSKRLAHEYARLVAQPESQDRNFALDCNRDAHRATVRVNLLLASALMEDDEPESVDPVTMAKAAADGHDPECDCHWIARESGRALADGDHFAGMPA
jgi:hypothetical protein